MRILQTVHGFLPNQRAGTEIYTNDLCKELAKRNEVHVLYPVYRGRKYDLNSFDREGIRIYELTVPLGFLEKINYATNFRSTYENKETEQKFAKLLNIVKPDIIHFQHLIYLSASLIRIGKDRKIPTVLTLHDYWFICPRIHLLKMDYSLCKGPDENCQNCFQCWNIQKVDTLYGYLSKCGFPQRLSKSLLGFICQAANPIEEFIRRSDYMKSLLRRVDRIIAPSRFLMNMFVQSGVPREKIIHSPKGYNLSAFKNFKKKDGHKLSFGFLGATAKHKGFDILIEAFNEINTNDVELRIYGNHHLDSKDIEKMQFKMRNRNIRFMGAYEDVREPYSEIDVLVFPSICYENRPLALTESIITETPIIASNIGSIPELVKDGENGLLFEVGNSKDLYKKMIAVIESPDLLENLRRKSDQIKSIKNQAEDIEEIYQGILRGSRQNFS